MADGGGTHVGGFSKKRYPLDYPPPKLLSKQPTQPHLHRLQTHLETSSAAGEDRLAPDSPPSDMNCQQVN